MSSLDTFFNGSDQSVESVKPSASSTALKLDSWSIKKGKEIHDNSSVLDCTFAGEDKDLLAADLIAAAWEPKPELAGSCKDRNRSDYIRSLMSTREYQELHQHTKLSRVASELAAAKFANGFRDYVADCPENESPEEAERNALRIAASAVNEAQDDVEQCEAMVNALGLDASDRVEGNGNAQEVINLFEKFRRNDRLQQIVDLAGKYRMLAQSKQRTKKCYGREEVVGVEPTGSIESLLASEVVQIADPSLELDLIRKVLEASAMGYEFVGKESEAQGPIVVLVDESGSMQDGRLEHAKAIALAAAYIARRQKRYCCLVGFNRGRGGTFLPMPNGDCDPNELYHWLSRWPHGGTDLVTLYDELPEQWDSIGATDGKTDIIMITDACMSTGTEERRKDFLKWKASKSARMQTIVIGEDVGELAWISDESSRVEELGVEVEAVANALSV